MAYYVECFGLVGFAMSVSHEVVRRCKIESLMSLVLMKRVAYCCVVVSVAVIKIVQSYPISQPQYITYFLLASSRGESPPNCASLSGLFRVRKHVLDTSSDIDKAIVCIWAVWA